MSELQEPERFENASEEDELMAAHGEASPDEGELMAPPEAEGPGADPSSA
ncbi:MAG TPA: hypothetical protein VE995_08560 [Gaiellaceae bacterium]|nr:hypothetical protein [Gaiellaceae bacterium]